MYKVKLSFFFFIFILVQSKVHIDVQELRCLVCEATIDELNDLVKGIDPARKVEIGSYQIDSKGNLKQKIVSQAKSEVHLSELADEVCKKFEGYIRATWKKDGTLTILKIIKDGHMNSDMSEVDVIQDDDLNKSLEYYCEGIMEEHEDRIIELFKNESGDIKNKVCSQQAKLCADQLPDLNKRIEDEL
ncbi:hypothetical protein FQA39_LY17832 [Lamprigera yunnana]|nr:hypothetical protein FQA39_LY17832 [Lamprigera yunnana]